MAWRQDRPSGPLAVSPPWLAGTDVIVVLLARPGQHPVGVIVLSRRCPAGATSQKVEFLIKTVRPADRGPYSYSELAARKNIDDELGLFTPSPRCSPYRGHHGRCDPHVPGQLLARKNPSPRGSRRSKRELPAASGWSLMRSTTPSPATVRGSDAPPAPTRSGCSSRSLWTVLSVCWHCRSNDRTRQIAPRAGRRPEGLRATPPHDSTPRQAHVDSGNPGRRTGGHLRIFRRCPFGIQVRHQRRRSLTTGAPLEQAGPCD